MWLTHTMGIYDEVFEPYAERGELCFRGIHVFKTGIVGTWMQEHEWMVLVGGEEAQPPPSLASPGLDIDPWASGGTSIVPTGMPSTPDEIRGLTQW
jgi:hypothetical protein